MCKCTFSTKRAFWHLPVSTYFSFEFLLKVTLCCDNFSRLDRNYIVFWVEGREIIFGFVLRVVMFRSSIIPIFVRVCVGVDLGAVIESIEVVVYVCVQVLWLVIKIVFSPIKIEVVIMIYPAAIHDWFHININIYHYTMTLCIDRLVWAQLRLYICLWHL